LKEMYFTPNRRRRVMAMVPSYRQEIIDTAPIAYWPMNELAGAAAVNYGTLGVAANGAYTGVTLADTNAPGEGLAPFFSGLDGVYLDVYSAALAAAFSGAAGSVMVWSKVFDAGVWVNGLLGYVLKLQASGSNYVIVNKQATNNQMRLAYNAAGTLEQYLVVEAPTAWTCYVITWSKAAEQVIHYRNGVPMETDINLGIFAGSLNADTTIIGSVAVSVASFTWHGHIAHPAIWTRALLPAEVLALYNGGL
jgi:hypothetical protein